VTNATFTSEISPYTKFTEKDMGDMAHYIPMSKKIGGHVFRVPYAHEATRSTQHN